MKYTRELSAAVLSPIALLGYAQEFLRLPKRW